MSARIVDVEALRIPAHVSGPWQVVSENYNHGQLARYAISSGTRAVAATIDGELPTVARSIADLIVAAPDLLAEVIERRARDSSLKAREAQVAELVEALESIRQYGSDTLSGPVGRPSDREWHRESVLEMTRRATRALSAIRGGATE